MDASTSSADTAPGRRTKSWKREHEETCIRRNSNIHNNGQKGSSCDNDNYVPFEFEPSEQEIQSSSKHILITDICNDPLTYENISVSSPENVDEETGSTVSSTESCTIPCTESNTLSLSVLEVLSDTVCDIVSDTLPVTACDAASSMISSTVPGNIVPKETNVKMKCNIGNEVEDCTKLFEYCSGVERVSEKDDRLTCESTNRVLKNSLMFGGDRRSISVDSDADGTSVTDSRNDDFCNEVNDGRKEQFTNVSLQRMRQRDSDDHEDVSDIEDTESFQVLYTDIEPEDKYDLVGINTECSVNHEKSISPAECKVYTEETSVEFKKLMNENNIDIETSVISSSDYVMDTCIENKSENYYKDKPSEQTKMYIGLDDKALSERNVLDRNISEDTTLLSSLVIEQCDNKISESSEHVDNGFNNVCVEENVSANASRVINTQCVDVLTKDITLEMLKEFRDIHTKDIDVIPLEVYLSNGMGDSYFSSFGNDIVGFTVGCDGRVQVVMPRQRIKLDEKLSVNSDDANYLEKLHLLSQVIETEQKIAMKDTLRAINSNVASQRPDDRYFTRLDSSLKKNTAFVRKLKTFTGNQLENLLKEFLSLNLTKYVSEVAAALVEAKLKMVDVWPAVQICNLFHGTYAEFAPHLLDNWHKVLTIKKDEKIANAAKLRVDIRFYAELINIGIFTHKEGLPLMGNILTMLTHTDKEEHLNINIVLSFCRHCGDEYAGLTPRRLRELAAKYNITLPHHKFLPKEKQRNVKALLRDYFNSMCKHLLKEHLDLQSFIRQNRKILQTKGELSSERKERLEMLQTSFERITNGTQQFAEALDEDMPILPEDESLKNETMILNGGSESEEGVLIASLWEDEETRRFYECLPDMKEFMPSLQVRVSEPESQITEETLDAEFDVELGGDTGVEEEVSLPEIDENEESEPIGNLTNKTLLESFLTALPNCINREMIDSAAVDFVMTLNTKHNRRKLVKALFNVPRIRLDLLPFYARLVATLHPVMSDIAVELAQMLKQDFRYHVRKKDQMNIESKIKVVRFIGELVKFRMYSKIEGLYCLKVLVQDFTHHHIEMCCNLLESCGRFFFRHPDCHQRMKVYLEQIMRKKAVIALDSRYVTMIENAYYYVNPPESAQYVTKERPVEYQFIRKILYQMLMKSNTDRVLRLMRKLDWMNVVTHAYAVKCLTYAFKVKYFNIRCLASLLAGLAIHQEAVGLQVVDGVLEDIRLGMEVNLPKYNQRRVAMIKYLGELYNYRMVESSNIFQVLYSLITFGVSWEHGNSSPLDQSDNLFRIRLVCVLLETCGQYFISGMSKKKLDIFLTYFQHYFWFKHSDPVWTADNVFPIGINYMFKDTITSLRPNIILFSSYTEATEAVTKLRKEETVNLLPQGEVVADIKDDSSDSNKIITEGIGRGPQKDTMEDDFMNDEEEEYEEDDCEFGNNGDKEEDEDDLGDTLSGDIDDPEMDWVGSNDPSSHMSEGDSQSQELPISSASDILHHGPKLLECPEDEDFLTAFDRMVSDNIQDRMRETVKPQQVDISVPLHIKGSSKKTYDQLREEESAKSSVNFVLMLRKGHKQQYKSLEVPVNSEMALNLKNREEAERAEKERVKRLTLDINERLEEEDYQEMLAQAQRPVVMNLNRERRHKYQHPKGAPDADLIFGPKKVR